MGVKKIYNKGLFLLSFILIFIVFLSFNTKAEIVANDNNKYYIENPNNDFTFQININDEKGLQFLYFKIKEIEKNNNYDLNHIRNEKDNLIIDFELNKSIYYENNGQKELPLYNGLYSYTYDINQGKYYLYYLFRIDNILFKDILNKNINFTYSNSSAFNNRRELEQEMLDSKKNILERLYKRINLINEISEKINDIESVINDEKLIINSEKQYEIQQFKTLVNDFKYNIFDNIKEYQSLKYGFELDYKEILEKYNQIFNVKRKEYIIDIDKYEIQSELDDYYRLFYHSLNYLKQEKKLEIEHLTNEIHNFRQTIISNFQYSRYREIMIKIKNNIDIFQNVKQINSTNEELQRQIEELTQQKQTLEEKKRQLEREKQSLQNEKESLTASNSQKESQINLLNNNILTLNNRIQEKDNEIVLLNAKIAESANNERTNTQGEETQKENNVKQKADKIGEEILKYLPYVLIAFFGLILVIIILKLTLGLLFRRKRR